MKLICIENYIGIASVNGPKATIVNKDETYEYNISSDFVYKALCNLETLKEFYFIYKNNNYIGIIPKKYFITLAEYREQKINSILNG